MARFFPLCAAIAALAACLHAKPGGFRSVAGHAELRSEFLVESRGNVVIEWDSFSLAPSEAIQFAQADRNSAVLNRVVGKSSSEIFGQIHSNGSVYLINSNGILIGKDAQIDTFSFIASSLDALDADFLAGKALLFSGEGQGSIVNCGMISCPEGNIALLSRTQIENRGTLSAQNVLLGVGSEILLQPEKTPRILIRTASNAEDLSTELQNHSSAYAKAIQNKGIIEALSVQERGGEVFLVAENGICETSGAITARNEQGRGGIVHILGECVGLLEGATVDVSGHSGGGAILVGGDVQGKNPDVRNARVTFMARGASLTADALSEGNGGTIVLWSQEATRAYGKASARGGAFGGDGGFVEVSGAYLESTGFFADRVAPFGKAGILLFDPLDITITGGGNTANVAFVAPNYQGGGGTPCDPSPANIQNTDIEANLVTGNVVINTSATNWGPCAVGDVGTIAVSAAVSWMTANSLTLTADASISVSAGLTCMGSGAITLTANGTGSSTHGISLSALLSSSGGNISLTGTGGSGSNVHGILFNAGGQITTSGTGTITLTGTGGPTGNGCFGVYLPVGAGSGLSAGTGLITIDGTGGAAAGGNTNDGGVIQQNISSTGNILLKGQAGNGTGGFNTGLITSTPGSPMTTITTTGVGATITYQNCIGGTSGSFNRGLIIGTDIMITAPSGSIIFQNIRGGGSGGGSDNRGLEIGSNGIIDAPTITSMAGPGHIVGGSGTGANNHGMEITGAGARIGRTSGMTPANITLTVQNSGATVGSNCHGIVVISSATISTVSTGTITLSGTAGNGTDFCSGISVLGTGTVHSETGKITLTGTGNGTGQLCRGLSLDAGVTSVSGEIELIGTSNATGLNAHGAAVNAAWSPTTTGAITFTSCSAGTGSTSHGVQVGAAITAAGVIQTSGTAATGRGSGGIGFNAAVTITAAGNINLTARSLGTGAAHGISLTGAMSTSGMMTTITLNGTSSASGTAAHGINISGSGKVTTTTGAIDITGTVPALAGASSHGISTSATNPITSTSGTITLNATNNATNTTCHGINIAAAWAPLTSSDVTLTGTTTGGAQSIGVRIGAAITPVGNFSATGTGGNSGGGGTFGHTGILLPAGGAVTTTNGNITLDGTGRGGAGSFANLGIDVVNGSLSSTNGIITLSGLGGIGANNGCNDPFLASSGVACGNISSTNGSIVFSNCHGGTGGNCDFGVQYYAGTVDAPTITATVGIQGGAGTGSNNHGFYINGRTLGTSAAARTIAITATAVGTGSNDNGIKVDRPSSAGKILSGAGGMITLNGTGSATGGSSAYGIHITGTGTEVSTVNGALSLTGTGGAGGTVAGTQIDVNGTVKTTGSGNLTFSGTPNTTLGSGVTVSTATGIINFVSPTVLGATLSITASGAGTITFSNTLNATTAGVESLTLSTAAGGMVNVNGTVGGTARLNTLTVSGANECAVNADITANTVTITIPVSVMGDRIINTTGG